MKSRQVDRFQFIYRYRNQRLDMRDQWLTVIPALTLTGTTEQVVCGQCLFAVDS